MRKVPDISVFTPEEKACFIPYQRWNGPLLDLLARWGVTVHTCEQEVVDWLEGKTGVVFQPSPFARVRPAANPDYDIGLFGSWGNAFEPEAIARFDRLIREGEGLKMFVGDSSGGREVLKCRAVFPIQKKPALSPFILESLYAGIPVLVPEAHRSFFPRDIPLRYYEDENWKAAYEACVADRSTLSDRSWAKPYLKSAVSTSLSRTAAPESQTVDWGTFLVLRGSFEEAETLFSKVEACLDAESWNNRGVCLAGLGKTREAGEAFEKSGTRAAAFNLAQLFLKEGSLTEAAQGLEKFLTLEEDLQGLIIWPFTDVQAHRFSRLPSWSPDRERILKAKALHDLAALRWEAEKRSDALQSLKEAIALDPGNPFLLQRLAILNIEKGMVAQPIKTFNEALKIYPFFFEAAYQLAGFYCQVELYDQAGSLLQKYLRFPGSMNALRTKMLNMLGYVHYQQGNPDRALETMQASLKEDPDQRELDDQISVIYLKKAVEAFESGTLAEAVGFADQSLALNPNQSLAFNLKGSVRYKRAEFDEALDEFKKALELDPELKVVEHNIKEAEEAKSIVVSFIVLSHNDLSSAMSSLRLLTEMSDLPFEIVYLRPSEAEAWEFLKNIPHLRQVQGEFSGAAQAYNVGASLARGKYLVFLEDDVLVTREWLTKLIEALEPDGVGMVGPITNFCGNPEQMVIAESLEPVEVSCLDTFCVAVKRDLLKQAGGFDEDFKIRGYEDRDLSLRARLAGWSLWCHLGVFVSHNGLMPVLPPECNVAEVDEQNRQVFTRKWEAVRTQVGGGSR